MTSLSTFDCDRCANSFTLPSDDVQDLDELTCPTCSAKIEIEEDED